LDFTPQEAVEKAKLNAAASTNTVQEEREWLGKTQDDAVKRRMMERGCTVC